MPKITPDSDRSFNNLVISPQPPPQSKDPFFFDQMLVLETDLSIDKSVNKTPVVFNGGAVITSVVPFSLTESIYLDGIDSFVQVDGALSGITSSDSLTFEMWIYPVSISSSAVLFAMNSISSGTQNLCFYYDRVVINTVSYNLSNPNVFTADQWNNVSYGFDSLSGIISVFVNGINVFKNSISHTFNPSDNSFFIGANSSGNYVNAYVNEIKLTKGVSKYFSSNSYVLPTSEYTLLGDPFESSVSFLANFNTTVEDETTYNHTITHDPGLFLASPPVISTTQSKFGSASLYYNNDTNDGEFVFVNQLDEFEFRTDPFTVEFWFYIDQQFSNGYILKMNDMVTVEISDTGSVSIKTVFPSLGTETIDTITPFEWHHIVIQRSNNGNVQVGIDGSLISEYSSVYEFFTATNMSTRFVGYLDSVRVSKGVARYPNLGSNAQNFDFLKYAYANQKKVHDNCSLLLPFIGTPNQTSTTDLSLNNTPVTFYNGAVISDQKWLYGGNSLYLNGIDSYIRADDALTGLLASDSFTVEFWIYPTDLISSSYMAINKKTTGENVVYFGNDVIWIDNINLGPSSAFDTPLFHWHHLSYTYNAETSTHNFSKNGKVFFTHKSALTRNPEDCVLLFGADYDSGVIDGGAPGNYFEGYFDNIRVVRGLSFYNGDYSTSPYVDYSEYKWFLDNLIIQSKTTA